jgi:hypothetical protein
MSKRKDAKTLLSVPSEYQCQCCKQTKPLDADHFQVVKAFKYGFSTYCLTCNEECRKVKRSNESYFKKDETN